MQYSPVILDLCLRKTRSGKSPDYRDSIFFKNSVFEMLSVYTKAEKLAFKLLWCEERFRKASFSCRISVDGRPNRRNKTAFSKFL